jgi:hypothetical protein
MTFNLSGGLHARFNSMQRLVEPHVRKFNLTHDLPKARLGRRRVTRGTRDVPAPGLTANPRSSVIATSSWPQDLTMSLHSALKDSLTKKQSRPSNTVVIPDSRCTLPPADARTRVVRNVTHGGRLPVNRPCWPCAHCCGRHHVLAAAAHMNASKTRDLCRHERP